MKAACHLILFLKAPRRGQVKTRLGRELGAGEATRLYRTITALLVRRLGRDRRWRLWLAVTPDGCRDTGFWPRALPRLAQGGGDLGQRMKRCFDALPPGPAVLIGADIPDVGPEPIAAAFRLLRGRAAVFGPAADGGYWLVGLARRRSERDLFARVRWSSPQALSDTLATIRGGQVGFVAALRDIDDAADYASWRRRQAEAGRAG